MSMSMFFWVKKVVPGLIVAADGSGDYTDIQSAVDALPAAGGAIIVKDGTYTLTTSIVIDSDSITITGSGYNTIVTIGAVNDYVFNLTGGTRFELRSMRLIGTTYLPIPAEVIRLENCSDGLIDRCWLTAPRSRIFDNGGSVTRVTISNNFIYDCYDWAIYFSMAGTNNCLICNNYIDNTHDYDGIALIGDCNNNVITNNVIRNSNRYGIYIQAATGDKNIIIGNIITGSGTAAILDNGTGTVNIGNVES